MEELSSIRGENESFEDYKKRMKAIKLTTKIYKKGFLMNFENHLRYQAYVKTQKNGNRAK